MGMLKRQVWGASLVCTGAAVLYGSGDAIQNYFVTGQIAWGRSSRRLEGEMALMAHGLFFLVGAGMVAEGIRQMVSRFEGTSQY